MSGCDWMQAWLLQEWYGRWWMAPGLDSICGGEDGVWLQGWVPSVVVKMEYSEGTLPWSVIDFQWHAADNPHLTCHVYNNVAPVPVPVTGFRWCAWTYAKFCACQMCAKSHKTFCLILQVLSLSRDSSLTKSNLLNEPACLYSLLTLVKNNWSYRYIGCSRQLGMHAANMWVLAWWQIDGCNS